VTVRKLGYDKYQLISGERRYKAAKIAGLKEIPSYIRVANDQQMLELALIENIHRKDLNSIEIAISYNRLLEECDLTQEKLSQRIGKDRTTIANYIRLLKLPPQIQIAIRRELITNGHARALINAGDSATQIHILEQIIKHGLSVREVENLVKKYNTPASKPAPEPVAPLPPSYRIAGSHLESHLNTRVEIRKNTKGEGSIVIRFRSEDEFERIINILDKE
jgi:ParB family chromosome partitioning protein